MKKILLILALFLVLLIALFPMLASTRLGAPIFVHLLSAKLNGKVSIEQIHLSWFGPQRFENVTYTKQDLQASASLFTSNVPLWRLSELGDTFTLDNGTFYFPTYGDAKIQNVRATIRGNNIEAKGTTDKGGSISFLGTYVTEQDFDLSAELRQVPTIAIDKLLNQKGLLYKSLGALTNFNGSVALQGQSGKIAFDFSSTNGEGSISANIENGILTLNKELNISLRLSDEFSQILTSRINPNFFTHLRAKNPFTLNISPEGFSCSVTPFRISQIQIGSGELNLGKIQIQSGDALHPLVKIFNNASFDKTLDIWLTKALFRLENGLFRLGRVDALLANAIHVCAWGDISLESEKLQMILGLPADTLQKSFGIQNLSRNYVIQIPVYGSFDDPKFETGPAIAKIATLSATQQIPTKGGKIFGNVINAFTQVVDDGDAPPPNRPFPWE